MHIKRSTSTVITEGLQAESLTCSIARTRSSAPRSKGNISCTVLPSDTCTSQCCQTWHQPLVVPTCEGGYQGCMPALLIPLTSCGTSVQQAL